MSEPPPNTSSAGIAGVGTRRALDWDALRRHADTLNDQRRSVVRDAWTRAAQMEHASIASFDRFSLQLLAVAAPPSLLEEAHRAAIDEVRHAQLSFAVASIYAQQTLGPGPLIVTPEAFADHSVAFVVRSAVEEGCVGETLAAAEAQAASERARHPVLQQVLAEIAHDEGEHAALAYRFASWAKHSLGVVARDAIERGFEAGLNAAASAGLEMTGSASPIDEATWLEEHGRLSARTRQEQLAIAIAQVVTPARAQLLGA